MTGTGFSRGKDISQTELAEAEVPGQIRKGCMTGDERPGWGRIKFQLVPGVQRICFLDKFHIPLGIIVCMVRVSCGESIAYVARFYLGIFQTQPDMRIGLFFRLPAGQNLLHFYIVDIGSVRCRDNGKLFISRCFYRFISPGFQSTAVDDKDTGLG